jgi:hypothetical protein
MPDEIVCGYALTPHAIDRIRERRIPRRVIESTIRSCPLKKDAHRWVHDSGSIRVVVDLVRNTIITIYAPEGRTRKPYKKYAGEHWI